MEKNIDKNKLTFFIALGILVVIILITVLFIKSGPNQKNKASAQNIDVWVIGDKVEGYNGIIEGFKKKYPTYKNSTVTISSFPDYETYQKALDLSFIKGKTPDVFMLSNFDGEKYYSSILPLGSNYFDIQDFKDKYELVFTTDLVNSVESPEGNVESLIGLPVGYEPLSIIYNRKELRSNNIDSWESISQSLLDSSITKPMIGMGNGSTVGNIGDIMAQLFLEEGFESTQKLASNTSFGSIAKYLKFGSQSYENGYDVFLPELQQSKKTNLDLFREGRLGAIIGYPSLLQELQTTPSLKIFLSATLFPKSSFEKNPKQLVRYNYFVINAKSPKIAFANNFLRYVGSDEATRTYVTSFSGYLPAKISLRNQFMDKEVNSFFPGIKFSDLYADVELKTFKKSDSVLFDKTFSTILDDSLTYMQQVLLLLKTVNCNFDKEVNFTNLTTKCN